MEYSNSHGINHESCYLVMFDKIIISNYRIAIVYELYDKRSKTVLSKILFLGIGLDVYLKAPEHSY